MVTNKFPMDVTPVLVEWIDSVGTAGWHPQSQADGTPSSMTYVSVGNLIKKEKDRVIISLSKSRYSYGDIMEIPMVAVKRLRKLHI